ncbi:Mg2+, CorA-like/Zinc transporter domain-containing protein [Paramicrosporidium saccamoebae]|uniref:Mg2+, CorA-like/Zinc transporter domain-containing protein n=1 Tax=Paramicrosporidium saccamoebae TaxID=1246581 RepID=A0A2H9TJ48_9FUNG|nr:Mg2+, CorA-like/Zinc transporter domain-containing protein [Paramicrosporidium saccamoebae]
MNYTKRTCNLTCTNNIRPVFIGSLRVASPRPKHMATDAEYLLYQPKTGAVPISSLEKLPNDEFFWLDIRHPSSHDLYFLETSFGVHPLTVEDIQLGETREKCESYDTYVFISVQLLDEEEFYGRLHSPLEERGESKGHYNPNSNTNCYLLIFPHYLISIRSVGLPFLSQILTRRIVVNDARNALTGDWLSYIFLDEIVDDFTRQATLLQAEVDTIEDLTLTLGRFDQADMLRRIYQAHRRTTILARLIQPKLEIIHLLTERHMDRLETRTVLYLRDVQDHLQTLRQDLTEFREALDRSHDNYLGQSDIELAMAGHRMNVTVKKMTALTFVIGFAMAISTIMGMNTRVPFQDFPKESPFANLLPFWLLMVSMVALVTIVFMAGRYKKWL